MGDDVFCIDDNKIMKGKITYIDIEIIEDASIITRYAICNSEQRARRYEAEVFKTKQEIIENL